MSSGGLLCCWCWIFQLARDCWWPVCRIFIKSCNTNINQINSVLRYIWFNSVSYKPCSMFSSHTNCIFAFCQMEFDINMWSKLFALSVTHKEWNILVCNSHKQCSCCTSLQFRQRDCNHSSKNKSQLICPISLRWYKQQYYWCNISPVPQNSLYCKVVR
jgi:hypothetical protein